MSTTDFKTTQSFGLYLPHCSLLHATRSRAGLLPEAPVTASPQWIKAKFKHYCYPQASRLLSHTTGF
jgi:hypothetical protein